MPMLSEFAHFCHWFKSYFPDLPAHLFLGWFCLCLLSLQPRSGCLSCRGIWRKGGFLFSPWSMPHSLASGGFYGSHNVCKMLKKESVAPQGSGPSWCRPASIGLVLIYVVWGYGPYPTTELLLLSVLGHKLNTWVGFFVALLLRFFLVFVFYFCGDDRKAAAKPAQEQKE